MPRWAMADHVNRGASKHMEHFRQSVCTGPAETGPHSRPGTISRHANDLHAVPTRFYG